MGGGCGEEKEKEKRRRTADVQSRDPAWQGGEKEVGYFADLRVGRELSFFKKLRSNPAFIASIKVFQQLISFKWVQIIKYF